MVARGIRSVRFFAIFAMSECDVHDENIDMRMLEGFFGHSERNALRHASRSSTVFK